MSDMPQPVRHYVLGLKGQVKDRKLTAEKAGEKLAAYLEESWPAIAKALLIRWCTARFRKSVPVPTGWVQTSLWPVKLWDQSLSVAFEHAAEQRAFTGRMAGRDDARDADLLVLTTAVDGDMTVTLEEAYRIAYPDMAEATG
jgi:hypothetical protein